MNLPHYTLIITQKFPPNGGDFPPFLNMPCLLTARELERPHLHMQWQSLPPYLCMISPCKDGFGTLFGDTLLWEQFPVCSCLLAGNKVPSRKIVSELSFGWQLLSIWSWFGPVPNVITWVVFLPPNVFNLNLHERKQPDKSKFRDFLHCKTTGLKSSKWQYYSIKKKRLWDYYS